MTNYTIIQAGDGYHIGIAGADGSRQTLLGFTTEAEAEAWIVQDKRRAPSIAEPLPPPSPGA